MSTDAKKVRLDLFSVEAIGCAVVLALLFGGVAQATLYWDTNGPTSGSSGGTTAAGTWNTTTANWSTNSNGTAATQTWTSGEMAVFAAGANATDSYTVQITQSITVGGIKLEEGSPTIDSGTNLITLGSSGLAVDTGSGTLRLDARYFLGGTITKTGGGTLYSDNTNQQNFSGNWVINAGTLVVPASGALGKDPGVVMPNLVTLNNGSTMLLSFGGPTYSTQGITIGPGGGQLKTGDGAVLVWDGPITGSSGGSLTVGGGGTIYLGGNNNYDGATIIESGKLTLEHGGVIPDTSVVTINVNGAFFDLGNYNETVKSVSGSFGDVLIGTGTLTLANPAGEINGNQVIASVGGKLIKNGSGRITFTQSNGNFKGEFVLNSGTIGIGDSNALGSSAGAKITINGGTLTNDGTSPRSISSAVPVGLNGDFAVDNSLISIPGQIVFNGAATMNASRTVTVVGKASLALLDLRESAAGQSLTKLGAGTLELGGNPTTGRFTGAVNVMEGRLQLGATGTIGMNTNLINLAGGAFSLSASRGTSGFLSNPFSITADSAITTTSAEPLVELDLTSSTLAGPGKLTVRNDAPSGTSVFHLYLAGSGAGFAPGPIEIANGAFGTTNLRSYNGSGTTQTYANVISGTGSFERHGLAISAGTTVFSAANSYSGGTSVVRGTLLVNNTTGSGTGSGPVTIETSGVLGGTGTISGAVTNSGKIAPGASVGTLTVNNNVTMGANSHLAIDLSGASADKLVVGGNLDLSSTDFLDVTGSGTGTSWVIATYDGTLTGVFNNISLGYAVNYGSGFHSQITLYFGSGDFNGDTLVDAGDYVTWRKNNGTNLALANDSGLGTPIGAAHYDLWRNNFSHSTLHGSGSGLDSAAVPEPGAFGLACLGCLVAVVRRRS